MTKFTIYKINGLGHLKKIATIFATYFRVQYCIAEFWEKVETPRFMRKALITERVVATLGNATIFLIVEDGKKED